MSRTKLFWRGALHALLASLYILGVATLMTNGEKLLGNMPMPVGPFAMLSLLVISTAVMGVLFFGRPVMLFLENKKSEALWFLGFTMGVFIFIALASFVILAGVNVLIK
ncbi:MAG: hypothetical protein A2538_04525 [Candidatus Magasanikbacteria bacterium RIFOXYD2_FULL_41_14]|uniref:MotA/TolQ/ExbB proton channel domain-containing protein n=1 Tax=Candidatus Magasanikbacteria bacterium RIFOXYD2_FULL_41_14 TaxID=1798709 RepID=A0A1F6PFG1_9BACT|nr:MAG: hypothetical protein A2538_04525 [Candidatus Magasanikbacteria bacterium RIFOXYD2_FULL_41_14]